MVPMEQLQKDVDELIRGPQYRLRQSDKEALLFPMLRELSLEMADRCEPFGRFLQRMAPPPSDWRRVADIPPLPVSMFKRFVLSAVPANRVVRELTSSSTTGQQPSRILVDKTTAFRQTRALAAVLREDVGGERRPFLVLDVPETVAAGNHLTARGAGIRGVANFASETVFGMRTRNSGDIEPDFDGIDRFFAKHERRTVLLFGFTFMVWTRFVEAAERRGVRYRAADAFLLHSGGWKKLQAQAVSKEDFVSRASEVIGCRAEAILNFYGMVEQVGTVFIDCAKGNKHAPAFADVVIRRPHTLNPVEPGEVGILEVVSVLPTSYPGQALLTEDQGRLIGVDDCPCGRRGSYFQFTHRIERAELRGCGDTFAQSRVLA